MRSFGHHGCEDNDVLELLVDHFVDHADGHTELVVPRADPALIRVVPDVVVLNVGVPRDSREDQLLLLPVLTHRVRKTADLGNMIRWQLKQLFDPGDHVGIRLSRLYSLLTLVVLLAFLCDLFEPALQILFFFFALSSTTHNWCLTSHFV